MADAKITRRELALMAGSATVAPWLGADAQARVSAESAGPASSRTPLTLYSRHLQWTGMEEAVEVALAAGYGGISWGVRSGAHIEPEHVERDLVRAVRLTHQAGLGTPLISTLISDAKSPYAESIIATATGLGIPVYRAASYHYDFSGDVPAQLEALRPQVASLVELNERHGATAVFHTHAGGDTVGGAVWDLWLLLREYDASRVAINFDTGHSMIKSGAGWMEAVRFARPYIRTLSMKDFLWQRQRQAAGWPWSAQLCAPGQGMVDFRDMLSYFRATDFHGPAEVLFEYSVQVAGRTAPVSLWGSDVGRWQLEMPKADFVQLLKRDADFLAALLRETQLAPSTGRPLST